MSSKLFKATLTVFLTASITFSFLTIFTVFAENSENEENSEEENSEIAAPFSDVSEEDYHYLAIDWLRENGFINGYPDGTFKSWQKVNRAEALKMITEACDLDIENSEDDENNEELETTFSDLTEDAWYTPYIKTALHNEIVEGYEDGTFKPGQTVTLAETLKMYAECQNYTYPDISSYLFADTPEDAWYTPYTALASFLTLLDVQLDNTISPDQEMSRGYIAEILYRARLAREGYEFGKATYYGKAVQGNGTASGETFDYYEATGAHKTLPFGSIVEVTNLANGKSVNVKINDRGPYGPGRVIDLSRSAFESIGSLSSGVINVQLKVIE